MRTMNNKKEMNRKLSEIEAEQFVYSTLAFIQEQADRFHTSEEFIEDVLIAFIEMIKSERAKEAENVNG